MRVKQEKVDAVDLDAVHLGLGGQVEHGVEVDERLGAGGAFADDAGPGCVVELWENVRVVHGFPSIIEGLTRIPACGLAVSLTRKRGLTDNLPPPAPSDWCRAQSTAIRPAPRSRC